ncbi:hypothetical protein [Oceanicaulis sp. MMSF_3324]|uniref:hypothetical protein n=1 Tax=Oceanicaulis sp. MMSF_3324 TaxID=3046702 RepID=UPI00273FC8E1|nr:hypothetical protein [Oceanicaulis sp. MMSF_3324]
MAITIHFKTGNAAFEDNPQAEIARVLRALADTIEADSGPDESGEFYAGWKVRDLNGNAIGEAEIQHDAN